MTQQNTKKTRILYIITKSNWGGAQRYVYDLATNLPKKDFDTKVALGGNGVLAEKLREDNIDVISIPDLERDISIFKEIKVFLNLIKLLRKERPDVVHLNSSKIGGLGALAGRIAGVKKIVFTVHGFAFNESRNFISIFLIKLASYITLLLSTDVIFVTKNDLESLPKWIRNRKKNKVIHNAIKSPEFLEKNSAREFLLSKAGILENNLPIVLSIGELTKNKDYENAIWAKKLAIKNYNYLIIGSGEDKASLENFVRSNNIKNISFLGQVKDASKYLRGADLFLLSSRKEGLPYVILEALSAGTKIVSTNVGGINEVLDQKSLVPKENPDLLAQKIDQIMLSVETNLVPSYNFESFIEVTIKVYN